MENREKTNVVLGVGLLFTIITTIFSLCHSLNSSILVMNSRFIYGIKTFLDDNVLYFVVVSAIIIILVVLIKKSNQKVYLNILQNENVRLITGVVVVLQGLMSFSSVLIIYIKFIQQYLFLQHPTTGGDAVIAIKKMMVSYVIQLALILCQIIVGVYFIKRSKKNGN